MKSKEENKSDDYYKKSLLECREKIIEFISKNEVDEKECIFIKEYIKETNLVV